MADEPPSFVRTGRHLKAISIKSSLSFS
ncbi:hypothetical protein MICRO11B_100023 [Micrococcus luteus]|nr:hypothetical protein MICRO11B_100023 [Micrococcus luteus]